MLADEFHDDDDDSDFGEPALFDKLCGIMGGYDSSDDEFDSEKCSPCNDGESDAEDLPACSKGCCALSAVDDASARGQLQHLAITNSRSHE